MYANGDYGNEGDEVLYIMVEGFGSRKIRLGSRIPRTVLVPVPYLGMEEG